jgi:hypothetical protein
VVRAARARAVPSYESEFMAEMLAGMVPLRALWSTKNTVREVSADTASGMVPDSALWSTPRPLPTQNSTQHTHSSCTHKHARGTA